VDAPTNGWLVDCRIGKDKLVDFSKSNKLRKKSHNLIPGGCHTYAKGDDQYPLLSPGFIVRGEGCHVWDLDGNEYIEYGMGNRSVTLGHAYAPVVEVAKTQMLLGANFSRPAPIEVECAETLLGLIDAAEMVKFGKNGSDVTSAAIRLARAYTGRNLVARCIDQPFFSTDDWFIGNKPMNTGVPQATRDMTLTFRYNDIASVRSLFEVNPNGIAALILEPARNSDPVDRFLHRVHDLCHQYGSLLILDEMITGFRWHNGGAQKLYDVVPDLSTFGKAMANGFSVSALVGKREIMERGGLHHDKERVFLLSTTHGGETHSLAAAIETMKIYEREPVIETLEIRGRRLAEGLREAIERHRLSDFLAIVGRPSCLSYTTCGSDGRPSQQFRSLFLQETIKRGIISPSLLVSYSHSDADIDRTIDAVDGALGVYAKAMEDGVERYLVGRPSDVVLRRYN
jgi:glutamate-1-semialdehyde 2,1-aminomutase